VGKYFLKLKNKFLEKLTSGKYSSAKEDPSFVELLSLQRRCIEVGAYVT
jgi:hypothetical protein